MPKNIKGCFSHESDHWATPKKMYDYYIKNGYIDPCPLHSKENNLNKIYFHKKIFINPPYSDIKSWVNFVKNNFQDNNIIMLIPARTDTQYFHDLLKMYPKIKFIKGRLHFNESKRNAPFPSILLEFNFWDDDIDIGYSTICQDFFEKI